MIRARACAYQGVRSVNFSQKFCVRTKWMTPNLEPNLPHYFLHSKQRPNFQNTRFRAKFLILNLGQNLPYLRDLGSNVKKMLSYLKSALSNFFQKVSCKTKKIEIWDQKYIIRVFLGRILKTTIVIFQFTVSHTNTSIFKI